MFQPATTTEPDRYAESRDIWNLNAHFWIEHFGAEGNDFHRVLVAPAAEWLLALKGGEHVLEVSCGSGLFARRIIDLGAESVVAFDYSKVFVDEARKRNEGYEDKIEFLVLDATDEQAMVRELMPRSGKKGFDKALSNMGEYPLGLIHMQEQTW
ncbi:S-adenosyl-L-methionine-dependent methyltransferase [Jimgerdemannia flammicorona]|uniref:S-adenosyl-L-methionine-dependent methyltransferase n=1 Tax=Jimgerdemannia flammicorona TaxID=994334 RepID=A0A433DGZ5_9FUNG|nr:S-adenosyl-L-methionine-dependent methyltransferase [Jimgerdemannia flammicorona]